jgi:hypothetical protein
MSHTPLFHPGDIVQLKSGSKPLSVLESDKKEVTVCWWDDDKQRICKDTINEVVLKFSNQNTSSAQMPPQSAS